MILKGDNSAVFLNFKKQMQNLRRNLIQNLHKILKGDNSAVFLNFKKQIKISQKVTCCSEINI